LWRLPAFDFWSFVFLHGSASGRLACVVLMSMRGLFGRLRAGTSTPPSHCSWLGCAQDDMRVLSSSLPELLFVVLLEGILSLRGMRGAAEIARIKVWPGEDARLSTKSLNIS
jgi:hypothetical protein